MKPTQFLFLAAACTSALLFVHRLETGGDNLDFILLAKSIQQGQWIDILGWPRPGGYMTFIAGALHLAGFNLRGDVLHVAPAAVWLIKAMNVLFFGLLAAIVFAWLHRLTGRTGLSMAVALLLALNQNLASFSTNIASETLFMVVVFLGLALWDRASRPRDFVLFALVAMLAMNIKYQGVTLIGGFFIWMLFRRKWERRYFLLATALGLFTAGMAGLQWYGNRFCLQHVTASDPYGFGEKVTWLDRAQNFLLTYSGGWADLLIPKFIGYRGVLDLAHLTFLAWPLTIIIVALMAAGFLSTLRGHGFTLAHGYFLCFHGLLLIWPDYLGRYLIPLVPVGLWFLLAGFQSLERFSSKVPIVGKYALAALVLWSVGTNTFAGAKNVRNILGLRGAPPWEPARYEIASEDDFADYIRAGQWIGEHAPADAVVFCRKALFIEVVAGRRSVYYSSYSADTLWPALRQQTPTLILQDNFSTAGTYGKVRARVLDPVIDEHVEQLTELYRTKGGSRIWVVGDGGGKFR